MEWEVHGIPWGIEKVSGGKVTPTHEITGHVVGNMTCILSVTKHTNGLAMN